jgi:NAD(P)-dependent dehydrogenase (short-subunit alcohol dehydrogenase family)
MNDDQITALVTGGARRIGKAIVEDLARHGFSVAIHCHRSTEQATSLAGSIRKAGGRAAVITADLADPAQMETLVGRAAEALGPVRLLVNNASLFEKDTALAFEWPVWDHHFALHVKAPIMLARKMAKLLPAGMDGLIVNIVDQRVLKPVPDFFSYSLSKSALWAATRTLAQALAPRIRVNAIGPGPTFPSARQIEADFARQIEALILRRGPEAAEFGAAVRWFWQARSVTGQMVALDGGQHLAWQTPDVTGMRE